MPIKLFNLLIKDAEFWLFKIRIAEWGDSLSPAFLSSAIKAYKRYKEFNNIRDIQLADIYYSEFLYLLKGGAEK